MANQELSRSSRLEFRADLIVLESLCNPSAIAKLNSVVQPLNPRDLQNFLRGYRLAVATSLHELLQFTIDNADLLDLEVDDRLATWFHFPRQSQSGSILSAVSNTDSHLAYLCTRFDRLITVLRTADGGLDETAAALKQCSEFASLYGHLLTGCTIESLDSGENVLEGDVVLRVHVAERILDYLEHDHSCQLAYDFVWSRNAAFFHDEYFVLESESHLDLVPSIPKRGAIPARWWTGLVFGLDSVVRAAGIPLPSYCLTSLEDDFGAEWMSALLAFVNSAIPGCEWPSTRFGLTEFSPSSISDLRDLLEVDMPHISSKDKLTAILGPDTVRLITSTDATDYWELEVIIAGATTVYKDFQIQVVIINHSVDSDHQDWVSIGVRLPRYGLFSNASKWYVFHKMYHEGHFADNDITIARNKVKQILSRFKDNLKVEEIRDLNGKDLLRLCELPAFREMRILSQKAVEANAVLRAGNSELLASYWLQYQEYRNIQVSLKRPSLSEYEYDVIGLKNGQCLVLEVKGGEVRDDQLQSEIDYFSRKVEHLRGRLSGLKQALSAEGPIDSVSGLFISLADLRGFENTNSSVCLWDYDFFVNKLSAAGLPKRVVDLLKRSRIIHAFPMNDFPDDEFSVGFYS